MSKLRNALLVLLLLVSFVGTSEAAAWLKQSTAVDIKLGPFVDSTDGVTAETGLTIAQADVRLAKNNANWGQKNDATSCTHEENGWYECPLNTTDTGTLGILVVNVSKSGALPVWKEFLVVPAVTYDNTITNGVGPFEAVTKLPTDALVKDSTSVVYTIFIRDSTTGLGKTGLTSASSGLTISYARVDQGNAGATTCSPASATKGSFTSCGFVEKDSTNQPGMYEFGMPNASIATGADLVTFYFKGVSGMAPTTLPIALVQSGLAGINTKLGTPAGASVSADIAGVQTSATAIKAKTDSLAFVGGNVSSEVASYATGKTPLQPTTAGRTLDVSAGGGAGVDWANVKSPTTTLDLSGTTVSTNQVVDSVNGAVGSVTGAVGSVTGAVGSVTGAVGSVTGNVGGNVTGSVGSISGVTFPSNFGSASFSTGGGVMAATYRKNVASQPGFYIILRDSASPTGVITGLGTGYTMQVSKDGGAFATAAGTKSEIGAGIYYFAPAQADTNCSSCMFLGSGTGAISFPFSIQTTR